MSHSPRRRPRSQRLTSCSGARAPRAARSAAVLALALRWALRCGRPRRGAGRWETGTDGLLPIPPLTARVTDLTRTLSAAEQQALEAKLADWEARTTNQLAVLIVPDDAAGADRGVFDPRRRDVEDRPQGQRQRRAVPDRQGRPEDAHRGRLRARRHADRRHVAPDHRRERRAAFREGKFAAGIDAGVDRIIAVVAEGKPLPPPPARAAAASALGGLRPRVAARHRCSSS